MNIVSFFLVAFQHGDVKQGRFIKMASKAKLAWIYGQYNNKEFQVKTIRHISNANVWKPCWGKKNLFYFDMMKKEYEKNLSC